MTIKNRLSKLEIQRGLGKAYLYLLFDRPDWMTWDDPEEVAKGYKIQPCMQPMGTGGEPFYLATRADLDAFAARPDVQLIHITFASDEPTAA